MAWRNPEARLRSARKLAEKILKRKCCAADMAEASIYCALCRLLECSSDLDSTDLSDLGSVATVAQRLVTGMQQASAMRKLAGGAKIFHGPDGENSVEMAEQILFML
ncbi:MAG: hypothetical protein LBI39_00075 [Puniceicoccales bacterium]|jgi:hypothetical protein|nr:hypothetical protein [Puniceicoccales bacterium]